MDTHETHIARALLATRMTDDDDAELAALLKTDWGPKTAAEAASALHATAAYLMDLAIACGQAARRFRQLTP